MGLRAMAKTGRAVYIYSSPSSLLHTFPDSSIAFFVVLFPYSPTFPTPQCDFRFDLFFSFSFSFSFHHFFVFLVLVFVNENHTASPPAEKGFSGQLGAHTTQESFSK